MNKINKPTPVLLKKKISATLLKKTQIKKKTQEILNDDIRTVIDRTISEIVSIKRMLDNVEITESVKIKNLEGYFEKMLENASPKIRAKFEKLLINAPIIRNKGRLTRGFFTGENKDILPGDKNTNEYELIKLVMIYNGIQRLKVKRKEVNLIKKFPKIFDENDLDKYFDENIKGTKYEEVFLETFGSKDDIKRIKKEANSERKTYSSLDHKKEIYRQYHKTITENKPRKGFFANFSLNLVFDGDVFEKFSGKYTSGTHQPLTILNLIKDNPKEDEVKDTIIHECTHNVYECFLAGNPIRNYSILSKSLNRIVRYKKDGIDILVEKELEYLNKEAKRFFKSATGEIIADFHKLHKGSLTTAFSEYSNIIKYLEKVPQILANEKSLSTKDREYLEATMEKVLDKITKEYKKAYKDLADCIFIGEKEGILDEVFALLTIYSISRSEKIKKWIGKRIGAKKYKYYSIMRGIVKPQFFRLPKRHVGSPTDELYYAIFNIKRTLNKYEIGVEENPLSLSNIKKLSKYPAPDYFKDPKNANFIMNGITRDEFDDIFKENSIDSTKKINEYFEYFESFLKNITLPDEDIKRITSKILTDYEFMAYEEVMDGKNIKFLDLLDNISDKHKWVIEMMVENYEDELKKKPRSKRMKKIIEILKQHPRSKKYF